MARRNAVQAGVGARWPHWWQPPSSPRLRLDARGADGYYPSAVSGSYVHLLRGPEAIGAGSWTRTSRRPPTFQERPGVLVQRDTTGNHPCRHGLDSSTNDLRRSVVRLWWTNGLRKAFTEREVLLGRIGSMRKKESGVGLASEPRFGQHLGVLRVDARGPR